MHTLQRSSLTRRQVLTRRRTPTVLITAATLLFGLAIAAGAARVSSPKQKAAQAKPPAASPTPAADDPTAGVEVTALAQEPMKFCKYGSDAYLVYVPIDITIVNGRRAPIILARALRVQRALLGKTNDDVQAGRFELATPVTKARLRGDPIMFGP